MMQSGTTLSREGDLPRSFGAAQPGGDAESGAWNGAGWGRLRGPGALGFGGRAAWCGCRGPSCRRPWCFCSLALNGLVGIFQSVLNGLERRGNFYLVQGMGDSCSVLGTAESRQGLSVCCRCKGCYLECSFV